jgi:anaerobic selenocysteine-containing dehydrogenase
VAGIAEATLPHSRVAWRELIGDYDRIREKIEGVFPEFADYNRRIRNPGGFRLPLPATERTWKTASGKAEFIVPGKSAGNGGATDPRGFLLVSIRSHDQYNTTIYSLGDRYRGVFGRRDVLFMNEDDLDVCGLEHGDAVDIVSLLPGGELRLAGITAIAYDIARGTVAAYYPEANCLLPLGYHDPDSGTPCYKSMPVRIERHGTDAGSAQGR